MEKQKKIANEIRILIRSTRSDWYKSSKLFFKYKSLLKDNNIFPDEKATVEQKYNKCKELRVIFYNQLCKLESLKHDLLKGIIIAERQNNFKCLSKNQKRLRTFLLFITFPIHAVIFIVVGIIRKFSRCFFMGLEWMIKPIFYFFVQKGQCENCKDCWAKHCEEGYLDGIKINGEEICKKIRWYETRTWLLIRRIFSPITVVIFTIIGIVLAIKKFFTSIIKVFVTTRLIYKDIWNDNPCSHMFKMQGIPFFSLWNDSVIICDQDAYITGLPIDNDGNTKVKITGKFIDMHCPRGPIYKFAEKPKSALVHFLCSIGIISIKDSKDYDKYLHGYESRVRYDNPPNGSRHYSTGIPERYLDLKNIKK